MILIRVAAKLCRTGTTRSRFGYPLPEGLFEGTFVVNFH